MINKIKNLINNNKIINRMVASILTVAISLGIVKIIWSICTFNLPELLATIILFIIAYLISHDSEVKI